MHGTADGPAESPAASSEKGALTATLIGRPGDAITAAITTTVVLLVAAVSPHGAWEQPILRLADTVIGVAVGIASAWLDQHVIRPRLHPPGGDSAKADG
jgi:uncharacterized membrane protein YccC